MNDFKSRIYACECEQCRALKWLVEDCGAHLVFSETKPGRLCELAVVAAAGERGIASFSGVGQRRKYAAHLGVNLEGPTQNAKTPVHIEWAISNSKHNPNADNPVNLGRAKASKTAGDRYFISSDGNYINLEFTKSPH